MIYILPKLRLTMRQSFLDKIVLWLNRQQFSESAALAGIAILVGVTSATGVWLFKQMFNLIFSTVFDGLSTPLGLLQAISLHSRSRSMH